MDTSMYILTHTWIHYMDAYVGPRARLWHKTVREGLGQGPMGLGPGPWSHDPGPVQGLWPWPSHDIVRLQGPSQHTEIGISQIDLMMFCESELLGRHKVSHRCPHNLQAFKEIHFNPKQHARKTISKMGPGFPWPDSYHSRAADGPLGPEVPKY